MIEKTSDFRHRFIEAMETRQIKAADLSRKTGISESTISQYRSGYAMPKEKKLSLISNALDVNPAWLMGLNVSMNLDNSQAQRLVVYAEKMQENREFQTHINMLHEMPDEYRQIAFSSIERIYDAWKLTEDIGKENKL